MVNTFLRPYMALVPFLGEAFGPDYEIVLHEIGKESRIVAIANNHVSGRQVGAPLTDRAMEIIMENWYRDKSCELNYLGVSENGKRLRSSTFFIKDNHGELVGLLCVNFDDSRYRDVARQIESLAHPEEFLRVNLSQSASPTFADGNQNAEHFPVNIEKVVADALCRIGVGTPVPTDNLTLDEKMDIVDKLNKRGVFIIKGAISEVAKALGSSDATIYRYLSKLGKKK